MANPVPARDPRGSAAADYAMIICSIVLGGGSIVLFAWPRRSALVLLSLGPATALAWDGLLSAIFFVQHSVMVRRPVRARLAAVVPARYDGAFYSITSGVALALFVALFQPVGPALYALHGAAAAAVNAVAIAAGAGFVWGIAAFRSFDPFGIGPIKAHLRARPQGSRRPKAIVVRGPYAFVRHPLYFFVIVLLWATPEMSPSRLLVAGLWTAWIALGAWLEERDLIADLGDAYREYCREVPFLLPWKGRVTPGESLRV